MRRVGRGATWLVAALLWAVAAGPAFAAPPPWSNPQPVTSYSATPYGMAVTGPTSLVLLYSESELSSGNGVLLRRSTNSGQTWGSPLVLSPIPGPAALATFGSTVDVVWIANNRLRYVRSDDGGITFSDPIALAGSSTVPLAEPHVARGPDGTVAVLWEKNDLWVRVSRDGGNTFRSRIQLASGTGHTPAVAAGEGVAYAAYVSGRKLFVRRSLDQGTTWSSPDGLAGNVAGETFGLVRNPSITADGSTAYVAYTAQVEPSSWNNFIRYRSTSNRGKTWSAPVNLSPPSEKYSQNPVISKDGGKLRVVFERCITIWRGQCDLGTDWFSRIGYRQSADGLTWSTTKLIEGNDGNSRPIAIDVAGRIVVFYSPYYTYSEPAKGMIVTRAL